MAAAPARGPVAGIGRELWRWWAARMTELLPARWRAPASLPDATLVVLPLTADSARAEVVLRRRGRETPLGQVALAALPGLRRRPRRLLLRAPPGALLEREVALPLAAQQDPGGVLRYELDRLTPFAAEEVAWAWRLEARDAARGLLRLRLSLLPRIVVDPALAALARAGLRTDGIEAPAADGPRAIPLAEAAPARSPRREAWRRRGLALAGTACGGLAIAAVALPFALQSMTLAAAERQIAALQPQVQEAEALRRRLATAKGGQDAFAAERARIGDALRVIATLTELLPDDTWLTELTLRQRKLTIAGRSSGAARLIGLLSADPGIRETAFVAPVTRAESGGVDVFSIRAELGL
ncbi:PilN domain-containing protein [Paracraurococcus lichenis]|uniref:PilN domain-containing protein n=1 Tax=Paracraurococcus lichenis TaxID=3064888 RepID=A0ABT9E7Y9_9PROT|nr:PilN domain-containing protein [Paracraurococcus sp. LOR1-02]MDO9712293.1 PilN domain-containing protein [Paracraurococcus sp. LOR1-02]